MPETASDCKFDVKTIRYTDVWSTIKHTYQQEGLKAFRKGMGPRLCINTPSTALSWGTYEFIKGLLGTNEHHKHDN
jgi:solute carrier family 25 (mitochondrial iron transporter), member 28/37